jgi:hypothetical protein
MNDENYLNNIKKTELRGIPKTTTGKAKLEMKFTLKENLENSQMNSLLKTRILIKAEEQTQNKEWKILPVVSLPIQVILSQKEEEETVVRETKGGDLQFAGMANCRMLQIEGFHKPLIILEFAGNYIGGRIWDCGLVLLTWFTAHKELIQNKRVIELGR